MTEMEILLDWLLSQESIAIIILGVVLYAVTKLYTQEKKISRELRNTYEEEKSQLVDKLLVLTASITEVTTTIVDKLDVQIKSISDSNVLHNESMKEIERELKSLNNAIRDINNIRQS